MPSRRQFVAWLIVIGTVPAFAWSAWRRLRNGAAVATAGARTRKPRRAPTTKMTLQAGVYQNSKTGICHYADENGVIRVAGIKPDSLKRVNVLDLHPLQHVQETGDASASPGALAVRGRRPLTKPEGPRVTLAQSPYTFERLALERLRAREFDGGCALLMVALEHDIVRVRRGHDKPAFRIYDLLALLAVRHNEQYLRTATAMITRQPEEFQAYFKSRLSAWSNTNSGFHRRTRQPQLKWAGLPT